MAHINPSSGKGKLTKLGLKNISPELPDTALIVIVLVPDTIVPEGMV